MTHYFTPLIALSLTVICNFIITNGDISHGVFCARFLSFHVAHFVILSVRVALSHLFAWRYFFFSPRHNAKRQNEKTKWLNSATIISWSQLFFLGKCFRIVYIVCFVWYDQPIMNDIILVISNSRFNNITLQWRFNHFIAAVIFFSSGLIY